MYGVMVSRAVTIRGINRWGYAAGAVHVAYTFNILEVVGQF